jgi:hypothetical protein
MGLLVTAIGGLISKAVLCQACTVTGLPKLLQAIDSHGQGVLTSKAVPKASLFKQI